MQRHCGASLRVCIHVHSSSQVGSEVDVIMGVGKRRRVGVYGRYCGWWNVVEHGRKRNQVKNMCMNRVWSKHGFGECMVSVGRMVWVNAWGWNWLMEEQVFENGKTWLAADGSLWCSSLEDAPVVVREEWRSEASFSGAALSCCTLCILACTARRTHFFSVCRWLEIWHHSWLTVGKAHDTCNSA